MPEKTNPDLETDSRKSVGVGEGVCVMLYESWIL